jgi:small neutral amino acid transporter SnatA (MarC family)
VIAKTGGLDLELILMTILVSFFVFLVLASAKWLQKLLGNIGLSITQRVMGLFVAAIGVQFRGRLKSQKTTIGSVIA